MLVLRGQTEWETGWGDWEEFINDCQVRVRQEGCSDTLLTNSDYKQQQCTAYLTHCCTNTEDYKQQCTIYCCTSMEDCNVLYI